MYFDFLLHDSLSGACQFLECIHYYITGILNITLGSFAIERLASVELGICVNYKSSIS